MLALSCLLITGCKADYALKAVFIDGKLHFVGAGDHWFLGRTGFCPRYVSVRDQSGKTVWRIETYRPSTDCDLFPLAYGSSPQGWSIVVPPARLKSGALYVVNADGGDAYHGAFRYRERRWLSVENDSGLARQFPLPDERWKADVETRR